MDIQKYFEKKRKLIDQTLDRYLPKEDEHPQIISKAMRYCVLGGGKRFRPILTLAVAETLGGREDIVFPCACTLELVHTSSLMQDDLPSIDDADLRRGRPACHKVFGEAIAVLTAASLNMLALEIFIKNTKGLVGEKILLDVIQVMLKAEGSEGIVGGEAEDIQAEGKKITLDALKNIHLKKTGALIKAAILCGAILSKAKKEELNILKNYSEHLGLAFQITDDILDVTGTLKQLGKNPGADREKMKNTYPSLVGLPKSKMLAKEERDAAISSLKEFKRDKRILVSIADYVIERKS